MNVLLFTMGADTGGTLIAIRRAFADVDGWNVRSAVSKVNYIGYPADLEWNGPSLMAAWREADVVHLHHDFRAADRMVRGYAGRRLNHKPYVIEHHGTGFRENTDYHLGELRYRNALAVVSTLDLWLLAPEQTEWLPCPVSVEVMQQVRSPIGDDVIRIAHAPTNRTIKSTDGFLKAIERLRAEGYPVEALVIEKQPWEECLRQKATADIYFDQVKLGYGNNAIEAWGMGIPVIAGGADPTLDEMERRFGHLPFYHATEETIYDALREMVESPDLRTRYAQRGLEHVRRFHDERVVVEQLKDIYTRAYNGSQERAA